jgi:hypothetical protein
MTSYTTPSPYAVTADSESTTTSTRYFAHAGEILALCKNSGLPGASSIIGNDGNPSDGEMNYDSLTMNIVAQIALGAGATVVPGSTSMEHYSSPGDNYLSYWNGSQFICANAQNMGNNMLDRIGCSLTTVIGPAWRAFDQTNAAWVSGSGSSHWIQYDFGPYGAVVMRYALQEATYTGFPKDFALYGSNDNSNFVPLDFRSNIAAPGNYAWTPYFTFGNHTSYRYYRLSISANIDGGSITSIAEIKLVCAF